MTRLLALLLLLAAPAFAQGATPTPALPTLQVMYVPGTWTRLALLADGVETVANLLPTSAACNTNRCNVIALPPRGATVNYSLRGYNALGEGATSNVVSFLSPQQPTPPVLQIQVLVAP